MSSARLLDHLHGVPADRIVLDYDSRLLRRRRVTTEAGREIMLDLPELTDLGRYAGIALSDGTQVAIEAAPEAVLLVRGDLPRLAWHVGNRHTPCEIHADHLVIREDHVLRAMLEGLGAAVELTVRPFRPEGGAYGHGRTMGHSHGAEGDRGAGGHGHG
jgi:urease accessory protein